LNELGKVIRHDLLDKQLGCRIAPLLAPVNAIAGVRLVKGLPFAARGQLIEEVNEAQGMMSQKRINV
jgi:hypothetical protein